MTDLRLFDQDLSNQDLLASLATALKQESVLLVTVIALLIEVEDRRLHLELACPSMFDFCRRRLGLSEGETFRRITAARLARRFPQLLDALRTRRVHLSSVVALRDLFTSDNVSELVEAVAGKTKREVEELVARRAPRPDAPTLIRRLPDTRVTPKRNVALATALPPLGSTTAGPGAEAAGGLGARTAAGPGAAAGAGPGAGTAAALPAPATAAPAAAEQDVSREPAMAVPAPATPAPAAPSPAAKWLERPHEVTTDIRARWAEEATPRTFASCAERTISTPPRSGSDERTSSKPSASVETNDTTPAGAGVPSSRPPPTRPGSRAIVYEVRALERELLSARPQHRETARRPSGECQRNYRLLLRDEECSSEATVSLFRSWVEEDGRRGRPASRSTRPAVRMLAAGALVDLPAGVEDKTARVDVPVRAGGLDQAGGLLHALVLVSNEAGDASSSAAFTPSLAAMHHGSSSALVNALATQERAERPAGPQALPSRCIPSLPRSSLLHT